MRKPLHKHIGRHAKTVHGHFTKYLYERDTIFATVWVFLFIIILGSIPLNLGSMNPIKLSLKDFDFNDLAYSKLGKNDKTGPDSRIVVVDIGQEDREGLAMMIDKAATMNPKVMAMDVLFKKPLDPVKDSMLSEAIRRHQSKLVVANQLDPTKKGDTIRTLAEQFKTVTHYGYANLFSDSFATIRAYEPFERDYNKKLFKSFSSAIIELYDSTAYKELRKKGNSRTLINYTRDLRKHIVVSMEQLMMDQVDLTDKIVLFGYITTGRNDIADMFFTPMNSRWYGKSIPDMNGLLIHSNIISMALDDNYIKKLPSWTNWLIAILICWLHMSFFVRYYLESHIWFHLVAKIAQVLSAIFFVWLGIYLFDRYRLKVDLKLSLLVIVLAVDVIYFYEAWAVWMHKKFNYKTVFKPHHH